MAQRITAKDIIGVYNLPNSNQKEGESIAVFLDNTFVSLYFGGKQKGTWKLKANTVHFVTDAEPQLVLYGRKLETLKDTTQLDFSGEFNQRTKVNLSIETSDIMQYVFNDGANCKAYPYIYKTKKDFKKVSFALNNGIRTENSERFGRFTLNLFTFEIPNDYNDLLAVILPPQYTVKCIFTVVCKNGRICFLGDKPAPKRPIESISEENLTFYKKISSNKLLSDILKRSNEVFPYINMDGFSEENKDNLIALFQPFYMIKPLDIVSVLKKI